MNDHMWLSRFERLRRIGLHLYAETLLEAGNFAEVLPGLGRIDINRSDDFQAWPLCDLFDDGSTDGSEAEVQNANDGHQLKIIVEGSRHGGETSAPPSRHVTDESYIRELVTDAPDREEALR